MYAITGMTGKVGGAIGAGVARIAAGVQGVGANFDFEVLSLPGGSVIAVLLWLCASSMAAVKRKSGRRLPAAGPWSGSPQGERA
jgi:hypothetical protein